MCVSSLTQRSVERIVDATAWGRGLSIVAGTGDRSGSDAQGIEVCRLGPRGGVDCRRGASTRNNDDSRSSGSRPELRS